MKQIIDEIGALAEKANSECNKEAAQMLLVVRGSLLSGSFRELKDLMLAFAKKDRDRMLKKIQESNN